MEASRSGNDASRLIGRAALLGERRDLNLNTWPDYQAQREPSGHCDPRHARGRAATERSMKKMLAGLLALAAIALTLAASSTDVSAQWRRGWGGGGWHGGWGWRGPGPGVAAGVVAGALVANAMIASRPPGYVVYPGYAQPVYAPGCYWASRPVYDVFGQVVGYSGPPVQVCPGYAPPPAVVVGPPPGPPSPVVGPPPGPSGYAAGRRLTSRPARPPTPAVRPRAIRSPIARSAFDHTIRKPGPIWATTASAIPAPEQHHLWPSAPSTRSPARRSSSRGCRGTATVARRDGRRLVRCRRAISTERGPRL